MATLPQALASALISDTANFFVGFISPSENPNCGHFIHGPQIVVHVLELTLCDPSIIIDGIISKEINHLLKDTALDRSEIGLLWNSDFVFSFLSESIVESLSSSHVDESFSAEFPAVVILHEMKGGSDCNPNSGQLYLAMSRALVYCVVILIDPKGRTRYFDDEWNTILIPKLARLTHSTRYIDNQTVQQQDMFSNSLQVFRRGRVRHRINSDIVLRKLRLNYYNN